MLDYLKFSEDNDISSELAKKIIDILDSMGLDPASLWSVIYELERNILDATVKATIESSSEDELNTMINEAVKKAEKYMSENDIAFTEIILAEWEDVLNKQFELLTTAKQTDSRYWNFEFSKEDLLEMATNFNSDIVGTEIPVDLNHDPEHIAYAWISPGSMEVKESTRMDWQFSLFANLYKFTPEGEDMVKTGKIRYFSLQIQHKFEKFVDESKKIFNNVIRALALTNMPVIKDMAPILSEKWAKDGKNNLFSNPNKMDKELKEMQESHAKELADVKLAWTTALAEQASKNKELSEKLDAINAEKHEAFLSEGVKALALSEDNKIGFKGGEMDKVSEFVKTLSTEQATAYFALHQEIITSANFNEEGGAWEGEDKGGDEEKGAVEAAEKVNELAEKMKKEDKISLSEATAKVLEQNPDLEAKLY